MPLLLFQRHTPFVLEDELSGRPVANELTPDRSWSLPTFPPRALLAGIVAAAVIAAVAAVPVVSADNAVRAPARELQSGRQRAAPAAEPRVYRPAVATATVPRERSRPKARPPRRPDSARPATARPAPLRRPPVPQPAPARAPTLAPAVPPPAPAPAPSPTGPGEFF